MQAEQRQESKGRKYQQKKNQVTHGEPFEGVSTMDIYLYDGTKRTFQTTFFTKDYVKIQPFEPYSVHGSNKGLRKARVVTKHVSGTQKISMADVILGREPRDNSYIEHVDKNPFNNCRDNLVLHIEKDAPRQRDKGLHRESLKQVSVMWMERVRLRKPNDYQVRLLKELREREGGYSFRYLDAVDQDKNLLYHILQVKYEGEWYSASFDIEDLASVEERIWEYLPDRKTLATCIGFTSKGQKRWQTLARYLLGFIPHDKKRVTYRFGCQLDCRRDSILKAAYLAPNPPLAEDRLPREEVEVTPDISEISLAPLLAEEVKEKEAVCHEIPQSKKIEDESLLSHAIKSFKKILGL